MWTSQQLNPAISMDDIFCLFVFLEDPAKWDTNSVDPRTRTRGPGTRGPGPKLAYIVLVHST